MVDLSNNENIKTIETFGIQKHWNEPNPVVLIVDDNDDNRLMLKLLLEMWHYQVIEATDGSEAIILAEQTRPDLILIDVKLPKLDGFDAASQIRQSPKTQKVPLLILSACAETAYKQKACAVGVNEYLTKPLDFEGLENALGKYIRGS